MSSTRSEISLEKTEFKIDQKPIDLAQLYGSILSPSEHVRVYRVCVKSSDPLGFKFCVEVRNMKDNWSIQLERPGGIRAIALSPEGDLITAFFDGEERIEKLTRWKNITSQNPQPEPIVLKSSLPSLLESMHFKPTGELITVHLSEVFSWDLKSGISKSLLKLSNIEEIEIDKQGNLTLKQNCHVAHDVLCFDNNNKLLGRITNPAFFAKQAVRLSADRLATAAHIDKGTRVIIWDIKTQKQIAFLNVDFGIESLAHYNDCLLVVGHGIIKVFYPAASSYLEIGTIHLPHTRWSPRVFSHDCGYLSYTEYDTLIDFKFDPLEFMALKKNIVEPLSSLVNRDPANVVLSYLFPRAPKSTQELSVPDSIDEVNRKAGDSAFKLG
ncbi:MAG: hypothetical protein ACYCQI_05355 [Gammaproteobacteria bacterium]